MNITIVGAGLGGLMLASVLRRNGLHATVLDLDASPAARPGRHAGHHEESGQAALRAAGLYDPFLDLVHPGGEAPRVLDRHGTVRLSEEDDGTGSRPDVEQGELRELSPLPEGTIRWGAKVVSARPLDGGRHQVQLADGSTLGTDVLVGADGAWSRVRQLLSPAVPTYTGISFVELDLRAADERHPACAALVGGGMFMALGPEKGFFAHREPDGSLHVYVALTVPETWAAGVDFSSARAVEEELLVRFAGWARN
ncbi:NAD(P)/FAD-dependent oxidoreductase [Amycolatopsis sp. FDAARGOS 1241]|uniref:FAD-dependent oxidoreductase n=1 Tax=Amycolatopsis sp. FDAARGOS 1241 TaxID=2778070 RepID=UPI001EF17BD7|nr:FAD-dependent monooxygenase [Amycolatopsis sp. FDAARGOS 1241]